ATLFLGMALRWPLSLLAPVYGFSSIAGGLLSLWLAARRVSFFAGWSRTLLDGLWAFTLGGLVIMMLSQMGPLVLERVTDLVQVGFFAAAFRIPSVLYQIPGVLAEAYYPQLFAYGNRGDVRAHLQLNVLELKSMSALGLLMALPFLLYPDWWMRVLFGEQWVAASGALEILSWMVVLQSVNYPLADALTTKGMQGRRTGVLAVVLVVGLVAYVWLGSRLGSTGGALAALLTEAVAMIGFILANPTGWTLFYRGVTVNAAVLAILAMVGFFWVRTWSPWIGIPAMEVSAAVLIGTVDREIRRRSLDWIHRIRSAARLPKGERDHQ
ncbi:MAG: flippase, partial [Alicyclobacillaceae bacterium]|nr:flippase [Alicyclobacillaceae bacterium]